VVLAFPVFTGFISVPGFSLVVFPVFHLSYSRLFTCRIHRFSTTYLPDFHHFTSLPGFPFIVFPVFNLMPFRFSTLITGQGMNTFLVDPEKDLTAGHGYFWLIPESFSRPGADGPDTDHMSGRLLLQYVS
jgi:hypothetical protein